jgi:molybdate transport system substrate-binding protein
MKEGTLNYFVYMKNVILLIFVLSFLSCKNSELDFEQPDDLVIFSASGFRPALEALKNFFSDSSDIQFKVNYASSGTLARQILNGADCDVFISANLQWITYLIDKQVVNESEFHKIIESSLVLAAPLGSSLEAPEFSSDYNADVNFKGRIAIGDPVYVPVGQYTQMVFDSLNWLNTLSDNLIFCKNVASVRHLVEMGECDWGIIYYSEALGSEHIRIAKKIPVHLHEPVSFYAAAFGENNNVVKQFLEVLKSASFLEKLKELGYQPGD